MPRFTYTDSPHWASPALIDWQVWDNGQRVSVGQLVQLANKLQNQLSQAQNEINQLKQEKNTDVESKAPSYRVRVVPQQVATPRRPERPDDCPPN